MSEPSARRSWAFAHAIVQAVVAGTSIVRARDPDLGFHLATGRAVLALGRVPATNVLSFAEPNAPAMNQQWLPAVLFELSYGAFGITGPILLKWLVLAITFALVLDTARKIDARPSFALFATVLAVLAASPRFVERPLLFSNLCLVVLARVVALRAIGRASGLAPFAIGAIATSLAVHLHAGAVFAFMLLLVAAITSAASKLPWAPYRVPEAPSGPLLEGARWLVTFAVAAVLAGFTLSLYHPHGLRVLTVPFAMASDPFLHETLVEFRPPWAFPFAMLAPYWVFVALAVALGLACFRRLPLVLLATMAFGVVISLRHVRFLDLAALLGAPPLALALDRVFSSLRSGVRWERALRGLSFALAVVGVSTVVAEGRSGFGYEPSVWPVELLRDVRRLGLSGPAFVQDGWAGPYLAFRYPAERVFFHPAFDAYSPSFYRDVYLRVRDGEEGWDELLDRHRVDLVLLKYTSANEARRQGHRPNLRQHLAVDRRWALVSFDDHGLVYVRRARLSSRQAREAILEGLEPDRGVQFGDPRRSLAGMARLAERGMISERLSILAERTAKSLTK